MPIKINLDNLNINLDNYDNFKNKIKSSKLPSFLEHQVDFKLIKKLVTKYDKYNDIIIIGNGGSIKSFMAYYDALAKYTSKKNVTFLTTMEPSIINHTIKTHDRKTTLVIAISKSGNTIGVVEDCLALNNFTTIVITSPKSALSDIAEKNNYDIIPHPDVGGRFTGGSIVAYFPAALIGIDVKSIDQALRTYYRKFKKLDNEALRLAVAMYLLEYNGYTEVFMPVYSMKLVSFGKLIVQLMHESVCKDGKGLTFYSDDAPESQHHTNQRFFGGKKNVFGIFLSSESHKEEIKLSVNKKLEKILLKDITLKRLNNNKLSKSLEFELIGTYQDAIKNKIPVTDLKIKTIDEKNIGELLGFWHLATVYSAILRNVNPYDQPQVERSKEISLRLRT